MSKLSAYYSIVGLFILSMPVNGQHYAISFSERSYEPLQHFVQLNKSVWPQWHSYNSIPLGFDFEYYDQKFDQLKLEISSRLVFDEKHLYYFDPLTMVHLLDAGLGSGKSKSVIAYQTEGIIGSRIFTLEYRDVRLASDTSLFINFQVKLYESDFALELHMGAHSEIQTSKDLLLGPYSGTYQLINTTPIEFQDGTVLHGEMSKPEILHLKGLNVPYLRYTLYDLPKEGQVIRYEINHANGMNKGKLPQLFRWIPGFQLLHNTSDKSLDISIYNLEGREVLNSTIAVNAKMRLNNLPSGVYLVKSHHQTIKIYV